MGFPERIELLGEVYTVRLVEQPRSDEDPTGVNGDLWGYIHFKRAEILVQDGATPQRQRVILLHELLHGIEIEEVMSISLSEKQVTRLARAIDGLFAQNPDLVRLYLPDGDA